MIGTFGTFGKFEANCLEAALNWVTSGIRPTVMAPTPRMKKRAEKRILEIYNEILGTLGMKEKTLSNREKV